MVKLKLVVDNTKKLKKVTDFDKDLKMVSGILVNPVITNLLIQLRKISELLDEYEDEIADTCLQDEVFTSLFGGIFDSIFPYGDFTEEERDASNDIIQLMLMHCMNLEQASAILSNMENWNIQHLNNWIEKRFEQAKLEEAESDRIFTELTKEI